MNFGVLELWSSKWNLEFVLEFWNFEMEFGVRTGVFHFQNSYFPLCGVILTVVSFSRGSEFPILKKLGLLIDELAYIFLCVQHEKVHYYPRS